MTAARALIIERHAMWHDGILDGDLFAYHRFVANQRVARVVRTDDRNVIRVEVGK